MTLTSTGIGLTVARLAGRIGAEIHGVDPGGELSDETIAQIRGAFLAHRVLCLREQRLDYERQVAFAQRLGQLTLGHPTLPLPDGQPLLFADPPAAESISLYAGGAGS